MRKLLFLLALLPSLAFAQSLEWETPNLRENGDEMDKEEIGGYEIRYTKNGADPESIIIPSREATSYTVDHLGAGTFEFEIAVYDTNGLYSEFVAIGPETMTDKPGAVPGFMFRPAQYEDPVDVCAQLERCRVEMMSARYGVAE